MAKIGFRVDCNSDKKICISLKIWEGGLNPTNQTQLTPMHLVMNLVPFKGKVQVLQSKIRYFENINILANILVRIHTWEVKCHPALLPRFSE